MSDLLTSTDFYILDQNFRKIHILTQYESLMWVDKYDEPGSIEIYAPPTAEIKEVAVVGNYIQSTKSHHLMVIEKLVTTASPSDGARLIISGRSLESILDRRVIFTQTYFHTKQDSSETEGVDNLEDAVRQLLDATFIKPENEDRKVNNFIFEYTGDSEISSINLEDMVFSKGENVLNIVNTIVKSQNLGYQITLNSSNQFVFKLIKGKDRSADQTANPLVEFSPVFNNIKETKYTVDSGANYKNYIYTEGEVYKNASPKIIETGSATGIDRREYYITSDSTHKNESSNLTWDSATSQWIFKKETKTLTDSEYEDVLKEEGEKSYKSYSAKGTMESEVEPRLQFTYGDDFTIGDIVQIRDAAGNASKSRVVEFIISHSASGYEEYPTFKDIGEETESPSQTTASSGEYSDEGKMTNEQIIFAALQAMMPVGYSFWTTDSRNPAEYYGFGTWKQHSGYVLRAASSGVTANKAVKDGGEDTHELTINEMPSHTHTQNSHDHSVPGYHYANTYSAYNRLELQGDGNLVLYNSSTGSAKWSAGTTTSSGAHNARAVGIGHNDNGNATTGATATNQNKGGGAAHNNMQSYKNYYFWERIE